MATLITKNSSTASAVPAAGDLVKGELAVNVTDKKVYTKDNSAAVVKLVGSLGNQEANAVAITGGAINGTTIGATTPSTGAFTTASASGGFTGNLTGNVTGNVSGTAANVTGVVAIANGGTGLSSLGTGVQSALGQAVTGSGSFVLSTSPSLTTPNLGTPSAAVLTNATGLPLTTGVTGTLGVANGGTGITAFGTGVATALGQNVTGSGGIVLATSPSLTTPNLGTPSAATLTNATGLPISTGVSGLGTGVATALAVNTGSAGAFVVNGGALGTPSSGTVTNLTGTASININGTVGATTPTTGAFTTLSASGNITVSGGTANGVAYLNGSKVLTTGSALTFDGTNLAVGNPTANHKILAYTPGAVAGYVQVSNGSTGVALTQGLRLGVSSGGTGELYSPTALISYIDNAEQMRLTSTGLGIGTSSPATKLHISGSTTPNLRFEQTNSSVVHQFQAASGNFFLNIDATNAIGGSNFFIQQAGSTVATFNSSGNLGIGTSSPGSKLDVSGGTTTVNITSTTTSAGAIPKLRFNHAGNDAYSIVGGGYMAWLSSDTTERMRLDSSGNLGLGVTPSAWNANSKAIQIGAAGGIEYRSTSLTLARNAFFNTSNQWQYIQSSSAALYNIADNTHIWYQAASGTAGNTISFTQAMTLDASGRLGVGTTSPEYRLDARTSGTNDVAFIATSAGGGSRIVFSDGNSGTQASCPRVGANANDLLFYTNTSGNNSTERARITSGGAFLVGATSAVASELFLVRTTASAYVGRLANDSATAANCFGQFLWYSSAAPNGTGNQFLRCDDSAATRAEIRSNGGIANYSANNVNLSDRREKTNFAPAKSYLDTICAIPVQTFNYIDQSEDDPGLTLGVVAQDVQAVAPELVMESNWGTEDNPKMRLSIYQTDLQYALMKALQELKAQNDDLRARVAQLEAK